MQNIRGRGFVTFDFKSTLALETNVVTPYPVIPFGHVPSFLPIYPNLIFVMIYSWCTHDLLVNWDCRQFAVIVFVLRSSLQVLKSSIAVIVLSLPVFSKCKSHSYNNGQQDQWLDQIYANETKYWDQQGISCCRAVNHWGFFLAWFWETHLTKIHGLRRRGIKKLYQYCNLGKGWKSEMDRCKRDKITRDILIIVLFWRFRLIWWHSGTPRKSCRVCG